MITERYLPLQGATALEEIRKQSVKSVCCRILRDGYTKIKRQLQSSMWEVMKYQTYESKGVLDGTLSSPQTLQLAKKKRLGSSIKEKRDENRG